MRREKLSALLKQFGIRPIHDRGQHFLLDGAVVENMLAAAGVQVGDDVVEIGPGPGILTEALLDAGARVTAAELDLKLCALLEQRFSGREFRLLQGDALGFSDNDFSPSGRPYKVVANIPYGITSPLIAHFLFDLDRPPQSLTLMVQREVAERIAAKPGAMSMLALSVQLRGEASVAMRVPRTAFAPPPKVDSAVIHISVHKKDPAVDIQKVLAVAKTAFSAPRRQVQNTLASIRPGDALNAALLAAEIAPQARPAELSVEQWKRLTAALT